MIRKFCCIAAILALIFALSAMGWAQEEAPKPDYVKEKEQAVKKDSPEKSVKRDKPARDNIEKLTGELKKLQDEMKQLPDGSPTIQEYRQRIVEIQKEISYLKAKRDMKPTGEKAKRETKERPKRLSARQREARVVQLRKDIAKSQDELEKLKRDNPDSPKLKELRQHIAERRVMLNRFTERAKQARAPRRPAARAKQRQLKIFELKNIKAPIAYEFVRPFMTKEGVVVPVEHRNSLIVKDTPENLRDIETIIKHLDVGEKPKRRRVRERKSAFRKEAIVKDGEAVNFSFADASGKKGDVEIIPHIVKDERGQIRIDMKIKDKSGKILSTPSLLTGNKVPAKFSRGKGESTPHYSLSVLPKIMEDGKIKLTVEGTAFKW